MKEFKKGQDVYDLQARQYSYVAAVDGKHLVDCLGVVRCFGEDGEWDELESTGNMVLLEDDQIRAEVPEQRIPKYLQVDIDRATNQLELLRKQEGMLRKEVDAISKEKRELGKRIEKVSSKFPSIGYMLDFIEGKELWVASWGSYGQVSVCKLNELKGEYGLRMVSIQAECRESRGVQTYDWKLHQYSDDSGGSYSCIIGRSREEAIARVEESLEKRIKLGLGIEERLAVCFREAGIKLPKKYEDELATWKAKRVKMVEAERERKRQRVRREAESVGLVVSDGTGTV